MLTKAEKAAWIMKREAGHQKLKDHIRTDRRAGNVGGVAPDNLPNP